jgi:hypothetical protein
LKYSDLQKDAVWVERAIGFGAKLAQALHSPEQLAQLGVEPIAADALLDRWAHGKESLLASG